MIDGRPGRQKTQVLLTTFAAGAGSLLAAVGPLISTPIILPYIGEFRYGFWMMLLSVTALIGVSDLGIVNGVTTQLAELRNAPAERRRLISNVYALLAAFSTILFIGLLVAAVLASLVPGLMPEGLGAAFLLAVLLPTILTVPLGFASRLLFSDMRGALASLAPGAAAAFSIALAIGGTQLKLSPNLLMLIFLSASPFVSAGLTLLYFATNTVLVPAVRDLDVDFIRKIFGSGLKYFALSILLILCSKIDYLVVGNISSAPEVVPYAIADRIIGIANSVTTVLSAALWPAFARELRQGNVRWVRNTILQVNAVTMACYAAFLGLLLWKYNALLDLWLGRSLETSRLMLALLVGSSFAIALSAPYFALANSLSVVRGQIGAYLALLIVGLPCKYFLGLHMGPVGVALGSCVGWGLIMVPAIVWVSSRALAKIKV